MCMSVCLYMCVYHVCLLPSDTERTSDPLEVELQTVVNSHMDSGNHTQTLCKSSMLLNTELDLQPYFKKFIRKNQFDIKRPVGNTVKTEGSRAQALIAVTTGMRQGRWLFLPAEPAPQAPEECRLQTLISPTTTKAQFELSPY